MERAKQLAPGIKHIPFKSKQHQQIIKQFRTRLNMARDEKRKDREEEWKNSEDIFTAYMPEDEVMATRDAKRKIGKQDYTTISIPYSYAMLLTSHTYYTSVFLGRDPIFQLRGRHGESQTAEMAMESLLDYQLTTGGMMPALFIWLMDVGKYSHGVVGHYWDKEEFEMQRYVDKPRTFMGVPIPGTSERVLESQLLTGYEGHRLYNIRPQDFYHDPRVPLYRFQEGEYCIVYDKVGWIKVAKGAAQGKYYNIDQIRKDTGSGYDGDDRTSAIGFDTNLPGEDLAIYDLEGDHPSMADLYEFHWDVVPSELELGQGSAPQKWVFTIANKNVIISAQPLGVAHNKYPFDILQHEVEGYNVFNRSMLEVLDPLNKTMEWLFNSHFYNVRAALNNMFLVDPSKVNIRDLEEPGPGKMIRLKPAAYGQDLRTMMAQFQVQDITRSNLQDSDTVAQLAQRITGVSDNIMGSVNTSGRKTATEVRSSTTFGINRLKTNCEWFSNIGFTPLAAKLTMGTQQFYTADQKFRIVGDQAMWMEKYMQITPDMIAGMYDFVPVDGSMPIDRFAQANLWQSMLQGMAKVPGALEQYDMSKIFAFVAQLGGLKNINRFKVQIVPDGMMQQQAQAGNVVPMKPNLNEPGQIPGMGATG
jgi:hypothetical protein